MGCISCGAGHHGECFDGPKKPKRQCCCAHRKVRTSVFTSTPPQPTKVIRGRPPKEDSELTDPLSSWRKRAAIEYPIGSDKPCDWNGKKNVGGGKYPIVGCKDGKQQTRHHGPVKIEEGVYFNFNDPKNIHRICERCHHLWHHWNDAAYDSQLYRTLPHEAIEATTEELELWANSRTRPKAPEPRTKPIEVGID